MKVLYKSLWDHFLTMNTAHQVIRHKKNLQKIHTQIKRLYYNVFPKSTVKLNR